MSNFIYRFLLLVATICSLASITNAQTNYYWNGGNIAATPAAGGAGTWTTTNAWRQPTADGAQATWGGTTNTAILGGTAGTVSLGTVNVTASAISVATTNYTLSTPSTTARLITAPFTLADNVLLKFAPCPSCNSTTANSNGGTISIGGNITTTSGGSIQILGNTVSTNARSYARLNLSTANDQTIDIAVNTEIVGGNADGFAGYAIAGNTSGVTATISGTIINNSATTTFLGANGTSTLHINGVVSGSANLQFSAGPSGGSGTVNVNAATAHTGITYFNSTSFLVKMGLANAFPTNTHIVVGRTQNTGTWDLNGYNQTIGALSSGATTYTSTITNNGNADATLTISGSDAPAIACNAVIRDGSTNKINVVRGGTGTTELIAASTYTGNTTVNGGTLRLNKTGGSTLPITANIEINSGGTLRISSNQTVNNLTLNTGGTLVVDNGVTLNIVGTYTNNGTVNTNTTGVITVASIDNFWNGGNNAALPANGGKGDWSGSNNWRNGTASGSQTNWQNGYNAFFEGTGDSVTLSTSVTAKLAEFRASNYVLTTAATTAIALTAPISIQNNHLLKFAPCPSCNSDILNSNGGIINIGGNITTTSGGSVQIVGNTVSTNPRSYARLNLGSATNQTINIAVNTEIVGGNADGYAGYAISGSNTGVTATINGNIVNNSATTTFLGSNTSSILNINGVASGTAHLQFSAGPSGGAGTVNLNTATTHTGTTYFNSTSAVVKMGLINAFPASTHLVMGRTQNTGTWDLNGYNQTIGALSAGDVAYTATITNNGNADATLTISGSDEPAIACNAAIRDGSTNKINLVRSGTGTTELIAASTYTGTTTISGGTLKLNKSGGNTIPTSNNVVINGGTLQISSNQTLNNVTITSGTLVIDAGDTLTIVGALTNAGTITNNGSIVVVSTATTSAAFINNTVNAIPNVTIQQWITGQRGYRVLSNPFTTALTPSTVGTANGINITGTNDIKTYTSSNNSWSGSVSSIAAYTPYAVFIRGLNTDFNTLPAALDYKNDPTAFAYGVTGSLNASPVSITPNASGFTLVGNPFAAPVNSSALTNSTGKSYYVYNATQGRTGVRVKAGGWSSVLTSSTTTPIPIMGVIAYQAGSATLYNVSATDINTTNSATTGLFGEATALQYLELQVSTGGNFHDKLYVRADVNASNASNENMDLVKLNNDVTNIYTIAPDKAHLAVDARKGIDASIPVGITAPVGSYTFTVANNNLPNADNVYLLDKLTNTKTVLTPGATYSFDITADVATKGDVRFELGAVKTQIQDVVTNANFSAKVLGNVVNNAVTLQVKGAKSAVQITVVDIQGKIVSTTTSSKEINTVSLASGSCMYLITITDGENSIVSKVVKP